MTKPKTLVVTVRDMIGEEDLVPLRQVSEVDYHETAAVSEAELAERCGGYDYLMLNYDVIKHISDSFYAAPNVKALSAIATDITGMDWASPHAAAINGVRLLNIPHYSTESVAETTLAEVLLHSRQRHSAYIDEIRGREVEARKGINLLNRTAGIVGLGSIGTRVADLLAAAGMTVVAWNRSPRPGYTIVPLPELFATAKVICICLKTVRSGPEANVRIITDELLARCNGSIVINLANVDLVDHDAMAKQIEAGRVAAYTVERSPALLTSALGGLDAVHMPPSNSWFSDESLQTLRETWVANVLAAIKGEYPNLYTD